MRITTYITFDMHTGQVLKHVWYEHSGTVAFCKGDDTAKATEQITQQQAAQQMQFNTQMMGLFQQQFAKQNAISDYLQGVLKPMVDNPTGYSPTALSAMRANATDT